jgi:hypothetical protein
MGENKGENTKPNKTLSEYIFDDFFFSPSIVDTYLFLIFPPLNKISLGKEIAKVECEGHPLIKKIVTKTKCQPKSITLARADWEADEKHPLLTREQGEEEDEEPPKIIAVSTLSIGRYQLRGSQINSINLSISFTIVVHIFLLKIFR